MNPDDAKFHLRALRPDGRDDADPVFAEALAAAARDPKLAAWHARERAADAAIAGKLAALAPPPGLREAILAGARASRPAPARWRQSQWLAAAAAVAVMLTAVAVFRLARPAGPGVAELAALATRDFTEAHDAHDGFPRDLGAVQARLAGVALPLGGSLPVDLAELKRGRCRAVRLAGREVFELCFVRDGAWYHLYVMEASGAPGGTTRARPEIRATADHAVAAWRDARHVYALVTDAGAGALQRLL